MQYAHGFVNTIADIAWCQRDGLFAESKYYFTSIWIRRNGQTSCVYQLDTNILLSKRISFIKNRVIFFFWWKHTFLFAV